MNYQKTSVDDMNRLTVEEYHVAPKLRLTVVLDNVRSQHNIGAVFRTADAFRLEKVCLCGICCCPPNQEIHKTALGAEQSVEWQYYKNTEDAINDLHADGYVVMSVEQASNSTFLEDIRLDSNRKYAVVLGHEVWGVSQTVIDMSDGCIKIPQYGTKHSLNVSVTAGIVMYELARQLRNS